MAEEYHCTSSSILVSWATEPTRACVSVVQLLGRRRRTVVDYREKNMLRKLGSESESDFDDDEGAARKKAKKQQGAGGDEYEPQAVQEGESPEAAKKKSKKVMAVSSLILLCLSCPA